MSKLKNAAHHNSRNTRLFLVLFAAALIFRLFYLIQISGAPTFDNPVMDEQYHVTLAEKILNDGYGSEPFFRAPLYPYILAALWKTTGGSYFGVRLIHILLGSLLPLIVFMLAVRLFDRTVALWSAGVTVLYPTLIYFDASLLITSLMVLLSALFILQLLRTNEDLSRRNLILTGLLLGLTALARPNILLLGPALFIWIWMIVSPRVGWKKALLSYFIIGAASLIVVLPVTVRNWVVSGDPVFISWQGGYNFYLGNNRKATGWSATMEGIDQTWQGGYVESVAYAEKESGRKLKWSEVSNFWYDKAWNEILSAPGDYIKLELKKIRLLLNGYEIPNNQNIYAAKDFSFVAATLTRKPLFFPFGLLAPLAIIGLAVSLRRWRKFLIVYLFIGAYALSLLTFFVCARFRQPMLPFLIMFAIYGVRSLIEMYQDRNLRTLTLILTILVLLVIQSNIPVFAIDDRRTTATDHFVQGNALQEKGDFVQAREQFRLALKADSSFADAYNNLGMLQTRSKELRAAKANFVRAIQYDPLLSSAYANLATVYLEQDSLDRAIDILRQGSRRCPLDSYLHLKLSMTFYEAGQLEEAVGECRQAMRLNPSDTLAPLIHDELMKAQQAGN